MADSQNVEAFYILSFHLSIRKMLSTMKIQGSLRDPSQQATREGSHIVVSFGKRSIMETLGFILTEGEDTQRTGLGSRLKPPVVQTKAQAKK